MQTYLEATLPAVPVSVREARETIAKIAAKAGASSEVVEDARLCVSEAVANVVRHAYRDEGELSIRVEGSPEELTIVVSDAGVGLAYFQREGELGYGLRIIEQLTHRCAITSAPHMGTEVLMVFVLAGGP